jgi:Dolichyl-phosphate-mannose-protein mannosyltransferase
VTDRSSTKARPSTERATGAVDFRILLLLATVALVTWAYVVPIFEAPDEFLHWQYARFLHDEHRLPIYSPAFAEGNSPPLYYALVAPMATRTPTPPPVIWINGLDEMEMPFKPRVHLSAPDDLRRYGPIRWGRLVSVLMSLVTIGLCLRTGFEATGRASTALLVGGLVAFLPQFAFRGSQVSNDALVTTMSAWTVLLMVRIVQHGFTWRRGVLAAVALAAAYLSKISAICLAPPLAIVILTEPVAWRERLKHLSVFAVTLAIVAPWSIRNVMLYGDPFASGVMHTAVAGLIYKRSLWDLHFVTTLPRETFKSFVGFFGYFTVKMPKVVYAMYLAFMLFGIAGLVRRVLRDRTLVRLVLVLAAVIACNWIVHVRINLHFDQPQGRYLFPSLSAVMLAVALGLEHWRPWSREQLWPARATIAAWAMVNVVILMWVVRPAYYPPLVPVISKALTIVAPPPSHDLEVNAASNGSSSGSETGRYTITGPQPELASNVVTRAADASFIMLDVEGRLPIGVANGVVILTVDASDAREASEAVGMSSGVPRTREVRLPFRWRTDGKSRTIYLTTLQQPAWTGAGWMDTVTRIAVRPIENATDAVRGSTIAIRHVRLAGSIPSHDF